MDFLDPLKPIVPADDQAIVFPCASVMVIMVLLKVALTCATPEAMFLRSRRRTRAGSFPILDPLSAPHRGRRVNHRFYCDTEKLAPARNGGHWSPTAYFCLPAIGLAGPLRVRALVWVRCPRTGRPRRCRNPR